MLFAAVFTSVTAMYAQGYRGKNFQAPQTPTDQDSWDKWNDYCSAITTCDDCTKYNKNERDGWVGCVWVMRGPNYDDCDVTDEEWRGKKQPGTYCSPSKWTERFKNSGLPIQYKDADTVEATIKTWAGTCPMLRSSLDSEYGSLCDEDSNDFWRSVNDDEDNTPVSDIDSRLARLVNLLEG